jgi:hypothetical protein
MGPHRSLAAIEQDSAIGAEAPLKKQAGGEAIETADPFLNDVKDEAFGERQRRVRQTEICSHPLSSSSTEATNPAF